MRLKHPDTAQGERIIAPQPGPQTQFVACIADVVVLGGAAGGGKSWGLLFDAVRAAALQPVPGFGAVIFRRTNPQIAMEGGLWDQSQKLYGRIPGGVPIQQPYKWTWPQHNTSVSFHHLQHEQDVYGWDGSELPYIGFDELIHFTAKQFWYLFSRNRTTIGYRPRVRATTNPDADSWVKKFLAPWVDETYPHPAASGEIRWFWREDDVVHWLVPGHRPPAHILPTDLKSATFIAASVYDNPTLLRTNPQYLANLKALPLVERERLLEGNWTIRPSGNKFKRHWFEVVRREAVPAPAQFVAVVRFWDVAATEPKPGTDPDYTVGAKLGLTRSGLIYVLDVVRERLSPRGVEQLILQTARADGEGVAIYMEEEGGSSGKRVISDYRQLLADYDFHGVRPSGNKELRANPFSAQAEGGNVKLVEGYWVEAFLNELAAFPRPDVHDDIVDASSGAYTALRSGGVAMAGGGSGASAAASPGVASSDPLAAFLRPSAATVDGEESAPDDGESAIARARAEQAERLRTMLGQLGRGPLGV